jgi:nucleotide-binding universal stress UspA family protein
MLALAGDLGADLLVVGTHGVHGVENVLFGSTAERLLRTTPLPVLAVPPRGEERFELKASGSVVDLKAVLAPLDLEEGALADARVAADVAAEFKVPLVLMHAIDAGLVPTTWRESFDSVVRHVTEEALHRLDDIRSSLGDQVQTEARVESGAVADQIARIAEERRAGLIVMRLWRLPGLFSPRPGTVAYRVLSLAPAPVLALPPV